MPPTASIRNQANTGHYAEGNNTLANGTTFKGAVHAGAPGFTRVRACVFQDQAGAMNIEQSNDSTFAAGAGNVITVAANTAVVASTFVATGDVLIYRQYWRVSVSNTSGTPLTTQQIDVVCTTV